MDTRFYRRRCEESRGDQFASWGASTSYFEVGPDNHPVRQIEAYDRGATLRYGGEHDEDEFGFRSSAELDRSEDWAAWEITRAEFERAWSAAE